MNPQVPAGEVPENTMRVGIPGSLKLHFKMALSIDLHPIYLSFLLFPCKPKATA